MQVSYDPALGWSFSPQIPYRGTRDYLHGTDLYAASSALVAAAAGSEQLIALDVRYPRFTRYAGTFRLIEGEGPTTALASSSVRIKASTLGGRLLTGWYEETGVASAHRSENHEKAIVADTSVEGSRAIYCGGSEPPTIEIIVFLTKTLLLKLFPDGPGKWVFTALRSQNMLPSGSLSGIEISLDSAVGSRAASCSVLIEGQKFGDIYFGRADE